MKRITLIFLIFVYAFSTTGVSLKAFYCCGKLQSLKPVLTEAGKNTEGCCKTTYQSFKVKDTHTATGAFEAPVVHQATINFLASIFQEIAPLSTQTPGVIDDHAPPLFGGVPVYISACVYRI